MRTALGRPSGRIALVLAGGLLAWSASNQNLLPAGPSDQAILLLPALLALGAAAVGAMARLDEERWPVEGVFLGAACALLGPLWAAGLVAAAAFVRWAVNGKLDPYQTGYDLTGAIMGGVAAAWAGEFFAPTAFLAIWLLGRRNPALPGLFVLVTGLAVAELTIISGAPWVLLGCLPALLIASASHEDTRGDREARETVQTLALMLQRSHPQTHSHLERVAGLAEKAARHLGLGPKRAKLIRRAARLHDIGKIAVDESVLDKPGSLTSEEYAHIKNHALHGAEILEEIDDLKLISDWVRYHHERPDGSGYPKGLRGDQIPLEARIIAAADAYDAMTGGYLEGEARPYRKPISPNEAIAELERCSGSQFDPKVVAAFKKALKEEQRV